MNQYANKYPYKTQSETVYVKNLLEDVSDEDIDFLINQLICLIQENFKISALSDHSFKPEEGIFDFLKGIKSKKGKDYLLMMINYLVPNDPRYNKFKRIIERIWEQKEVFLELELNTINSQERATHFYYLKNIPT